MPALVIGLVLLGGAVVIGALVAGVYNGLIKIGNHCDDAWANVGTELQRRYDLIPNLVATAKGYAAHERELLEEVTRLRQDCVHNTGTPGEQAQSENLLSRALGNLMVRLEAYPDLKANQNFLQLQEELANTEDRIQAARRFYNGNVRENNNKVKVFPNNIVAGMFGFKEREYFELEDEAARQAPKVQF
ncbi:MAG: LemA family protein [Candidatus Hydrogenedentes bacterium]|nr:LemA family protein [Candidatus Hydrogenedentota bacterium]